MGEVSLNTWISRGDILIELGELEAAKYNFIQAMEHHPENEELEFRISGICFKLKHQKHRDAHLLSPLLIKSEHVFIIEELFPEIYKLHKVVQFIENYKNPSN